MSSSTSQFLSNVFTQLFLPSSLSSHSSTSDSPLYSHTPYHSLKYSPSPSIRLTTDLLASSIRSSIRTFNPTSPTKSDCRVLVVGSHAQARARQLTAAKDFPERSFAVHAHKGEGVGGVFWSDDLQGLQGVKPHTFDALLAFNVADVSADGGKAVELLSALLKPAGVIAGTGLFSSMEGEREDLSTSSLSPSSPCTLVEFRERVESYGFFMHTCVDVALEGSLALHVLEDAQSQSMDGDVLSFTGRVIAGRFLATKRTAPKWPQHSPRSSQAQVKGGVDLLSHLQPVNEEPSVETQLWSLSRSLSHSLASPPSLFPSHSRSISASSTQSSTPSSYDPIVVTGVSLGLPNALYPDRSVFSPDNFSAIFRGDNFISSLSTEHKARILAQNVCQVYKKDGQRLKYRLQHDKEVIQVAALIRGFDLAKEYPYIPSHVVEVLDSTYALAIAAGLEALKDAGINVLTEKVVGGETVSVIAGLPEHMQEDTGSHLRLLLPLP